MKLSTFQYFLLCIVVSLLGVFVSSSTVFAKTDNQSAKKVKTKKTHSKKTTNPLLAKNNYTKTQKPKKLPQSVLKLLKKHKIPKQNISVYIRDLNASSPMLLHNVNTLRNPASTMKLLTTYAALKELGPNYSWETEVWLRGKLDNGVLEGDLILKGYGDPFLVHENFWKLVKTLQEKGLKQIKGDIIVDNSFFQLEEYDPAAFDGKKHRIYNAQPSALMYNFQATRFLFSPRVVATSKPTSKKTTLKKTSKQKKANEILEITAHPEIDNFTYENQIKLSKGRCRNSHLRPKFSKASNGKLAIKGKYATKCGQNFILRSLSTPEEHVFNAFRDLWTGMQGTLQGGLKIDKVKATDELFHVYSSPTLGHQLRLINKWSNNVMTKQLLLTLGAKKYGAPADFAKGKRAVLEIMKNNNLDTKGIRLENGSGLSRIARISAKQIAALLEIAFRDPFMPEFMSSLSLPGVDGTLVNRFSRGDLRGRSHMKSGTLDFVTTIAGYMLNRQGKRLVVVVMHNGKKTGAGRGEKIQNALLRWSFEQ